MEEANTQVITTSNTTPVIVGKEETEFKDDFDLVRDNMKNIIETGKTAIDELAGIAEQSQNARVYEVLAGLMETVAGVNEKLLDTHERKKKYSSPQQVPNKSNVKNTNIFIGSTKDLQDLIANGGNVPSIDVTPKE